MSKGGGSQQTNSTPWIGAQPFIMDSMGMAYNAARTPPKFYGDKTYVDTMPTEQAAWDKRLGYADQTFGGAPALNFGDLTRTNEQILDTGGVDPSIAKGVNSVFQGPDSLQQRSFDTSLDPSRFTPNVGGPQSIGSYGFDPRLDMASFTPGFGQAGGLDARGAYNSMLSGTPDYAGVQGAVTAANAPLMRDFEQNFLPSVAGRAGISGHDTGSIKMFNRGIADLGERMSNNALAINEGERQRALGAQERAAGAVTQGGFQGYGLGLQGASTDLGARQSAAQFGLNQDLSRAGLGSDFQNKQLQAFGLGLQGAGQQANLNQSGAQFGMNQDLARAGLNSDYRSQMLGLGGLQGNLANQATQAKMQAASMWPDLYQMGQIPGTELAGYGAFQRQGEERALDDSISRWDFEQNQPMQMAQWYSNIANGTGSLGGQTSSKTRQPIDWGSIAGLAAAAFLM